MKYIGDEICEKIEINPAKIFVRVIVRRKYVSINNDGNFLTAPAPKEILPRTMASSSLIAYIAISKFCDALPLYRQETIFKRICADITRQSMARWLIDVSRKLIPLYNLLQEKLLESSYIQMDETYVQVLKEDGKKATSKSYIWVRFRPGDQPIVLYDYAPTRSGQVPIELLEGFEGYLQVDGYDGYSRVCLENKLTRVGCWDHARRKFYDAFKSSNGKSVGKKGLTLIKVLYKIESQIKHKTTDEKYKIRQEKSAPILNELKAWIEKMRATIAPSSLAGKAVNYAFNEWKYLIVYLENGAINISNCFIENAIRPFCIGRKNWLFSASVEGAQSSSMYYSLIETAKQNDLEPFDYLTKMLDKLPRAQTIEDFESLLPLKGQYLIRN